MNLEEIKNLPENLINKINNSLSEIKNEILNIPNKIEKSKIELLIYDFKKIY